MQDWMKNLNFVSIAVSIACGVALYLTLDTWEMPKTVSIIGGVILAGITYVLAKRNES